MGDEIIEQKALRHIYDSFQLRGRAPSIRELMQEMGYKSPRSAAKLVDQLIQKGALCRRDDGKLRLLEVPQGSSDKQETIAIPLVGSVACGLPVLAEENQEMLIPVSTRIARPPHRYFLLRAQGDSMDAAGISEGDLVLIKQQRDANDGDLVVALIDQNATIKAFYRKGDVVVLKPKSHNSIHQPIIVTNDIAIQGIVVSCISGWSELSRAM